MTKAQYKKIIRDEAQRLGFSFIGFAKAQRLEKEEQQLEKWLHLGYQGQMQYMANHFDKRLDPTLLVPGAKTVISFIYNYYPSEQQREDSLHIAKYAYGKDYHFVIKDKLRQLMQFIQDKIGQVGGRVFVDSAPVMERAWAQRSGLGWIGKHTLLVKPQMGSFFFLAEMIIDLELPADNPIKDYCGTCTRCIDACPTDAIADEGYWMDGSKCISYLTIELKEEIPTAFKDKMEDWIFGCDICQDVCPWNRFSTPHQEEAFTPHPDLLQLDAKEWQELELTTFQEIFRKSAVKRTKYQGLLRNIAFAQQSKTVEKK